MHNYHNNTLARIRIPTASINGSDERDIFEIESVDKRANDDDDDDKCPDEKTILSIPVHRRRRHHHHRRRRRRRERLTSEGEERDDVPQ